MPTATAAVLEPVGEARVALEFVDVQANLRGLFSDVVVTQAYRNLENINIEAVYTFPLPLDAVLLDLVLELNGKTLRGVVQPKTAAEQRYENAIEKGDSAILLQQVEPGLFTLNVGNILPNEQAVIRFRYAQLHRWQGDSLRFHLPTTIAPRYGDPSRAGLSPHQVPEYALSTDHGFSLAVRIEGALAAADFECPSHPVAVSTLHGAREISLAGRSALMDRDFVLVIKEPDTPVVDGLWAPDEESHLALASFHPVFPDDVPDAPRCVKLVVDCSGSMGGDSIAQAKTALREIVSSLKPGDYFNLIAFGSKPYLLFPAPVVANEDNTTQAARFVEQMDANMGGTEIGAALDAAYACGKVEGQPADVLLITDGEVWRHDPAVREAAVSGHRIFSVGVGSAVSEAFVRRIAEATAGACELVSPRENMSERIVRHFRRIDQPRAKSVRIEWPGNPVRQLPGEIETVYAGDTLHVFGWFKEPPAGEVRLVTTFGDGRSVTQEATVTTEPADDDDWLVDLPRVAAHARLQGLHRWEAAALAERYQLVTEHTSCVLVFDRKDDQKLDAVPALRKVPHVVAAGWGGLGRVAHDSTVLCDDLDDVSYVDVLYDDVLYDVDLCLAAQSDSLESPCEDDFADTIEVSPSSPHQPLPRFDRLVASVNARYPDAAAAKLDIATIAELLALGLARDIAVTLSRLVTDGAGERDVVVGFLGALADSECGNGFSRHVRRLIRMAARGNMSSPGLIAEITRVVNGVS